MAKKKGTRVVKTKTTVKDRPSTKKKVGGSKKKRKLRLGDAFNK